MTTIKMPLNQHINTRLRKIKKNSRIDNIINHLISLGFQHDNIWIVCRDNPDKNGDYKILKMGATDCSSFYHFNKKSWINQNINIKKYTDDEITKRRVDSMKRWKKMHTIEKENIIKTLRGDGLTPNDYILEYPGGKYRNWKVKILNSVHSPYKCICGKKGIYYSKMTKKWRCSKTSGGCSYIRIKQTAWNPISSNINKICSYGCNEKATYILNRKYCCSSIPHKCIAVIEKIISKNKSWKEFVFPSGRTIKIQGYEDIVLNDLLSDGYSENEIVAGKGNVPIISYIDKNDKTRKHFPDIFIPSENRLIEVKSDFTYNIDEDNNILKQKAAILAGYKYDIIIKTKYDAKKYRAY